MSQQATPTTSNIKPQERSLIAKPLSPAPAQLGDIWLRAEGSLIGEEVYAGMELMWTSWRCCKLTVQGAWFECVEFPKKRLRFALTDGAKGVFRTKAEALDELVNRKRRHLRILASQTTMAEDTLAVAKVALAAELARPASAHAH